MRDVKPPIAWPSVRFRVYWRRRIVEQHEVDIGRIIQFTGAELAHAEDREPAAACRIRRIGQAQFARVVRGAQQVRDGERQRGLGQVAQRAGDALQRPDAADVGDGGGQRDDALGAAHRGGDRSRRAAGGIAASSAIAAATTASGPAATSARRLAASRTARSARYGLLPPRARSSAATAGRAASRASARPSSAKRSISRSAAPASCGLGQIVGRWKGASVMCAEGWA